MSLVVGESTRLNLGDTADQLIVLVVQRVFQNRAVHIEGEVGFRVGNLLTGSVVPNVAATVTHDGRAVELTTLDVSLAEVGVGTGIVHHPVVLGIADELDAGGDVAEILDRISLTEQIRVFQHLLVGVETVNTQTDVEEQVVDGELVLDIESHIDGLVSTDVVGLLTLAVHGVEEVLNGGFLVGLGARVVITIVADQRVGTGRGT